MWKYIADIFDSSTSSSFSRWATALTVLTGVWCLVYLVLHNHALPDALQIGALGAWMVAPYSVSKAAGVFNRPPADTGPHDISASVFRRHLPSDVGAALGLTCLLAIVAWAVVAITLQLTHH